MMFGIKTQANEGGDEGELLIDEGPPVLTKEGKTPRPAAVQKKNSRALSPDMTEVRTLDRRGTNVLICCTNSYLNL